MINFLLFLFFVLVSVGFFTLFERKVLGLLNFREGVGKSFVLGILHFLVDFLGGLFKE
jgi:NADH:ubiquinone oxidoreductase subunit H